jgi:hypothetical protein
VRARSLQRCTRLRVAREHDTFTRSEREDIRSHRFEFVVRDLYERVTAIEQRFAKRHRQQR